MKEKWFSTYLIRTKVLKLGRNIMEDRWIPKKIWTYNPLSQWNLGHPQLRWTDKTWFNPWRISLWWVDECEVQESQNFIGSRYHIAVRENVVFWKLTNSIVPNDCLNRPIIFGELCVNASRLFLNFEIECSAHASIFLSLAFRIS
jgi:hypothetical protein